MNFMRLIELPVKILKVILGLNMLISLMLIFMNVCLRTFFSISIIWVEPTVIYLIIWSVFLGTGLVYFDDEHISMGLIYDKLSEKGKRILDIFNGIIIMLVSLFLLIYGSQVTKKLYILGQRSMDGNIPLYLIMISIPIGAALVIFATLIKLITNIAQPSIRGDES
ncbi:hypothetical protein BTR23_24970 [Alkalihalophilus pseudofirmus]|nr:hypothetical protein BTR23_24970 [Alkalihalophilus pseudofirmus]